MRSMQLRCDNKQAAESQTEPWAAVNLKPDQQMIRRMQASNANKDY